jgi:hypothetical protein
LTDFYLKKHAYFTEQINSDPQKNLGMIIVIPAYDEEDLTPTLKSLYECDKPQCALEIIIIINDAHNSLESIKNKNSLCYDNARTFIDQIQQTDFSLFILKFSFPPKDAGVGLARKVGMDEAVRRFEKIKNHNGIIVCLDADCLVDKNYLTEIEKHFFKNTKSTGASIHFEHSLQGELEAEIYDGIILYELFLRYYINALRFSVHPYAYQTIGSSMAVRSYAYQAQGGMNKRKAGEDFYFLQKIIALGNFTEINSTKVIPSPRISNRVPFGTGKAIGDWVNGKDILFYDFRIFLALKNLMGSVRDLYALVKTETFLELLPECARNFLIEFQFEKRVEEIKRNTSGPENFEKRFFQWFNGFLALKYVHHATEHHYPKVKAMEAVNDLINYINPDIKFQSAREALMFFRSYDRCK